MATKSFTRLWLLSICMGLFSCANIIAPTGGPKDITPPVLKKRSLADSALNFQGGIVRFEFDEFVQLKDVQNQLIITPLLKKNPKITVHKKSVKIELDDSLLEQNTTYSVSMGDAIQDVRESNPYKNLSFTFSTGNYFDSLSLKGNVIDANTGRPDTSSLVVLYPANLPDSSFFKEKPLYVQKLNAGTFYFKNLPNRNFSIYTLNDLNRNLRYDQANEQIAFYDRPIQPKNEGSLTLYSFVADEKADTTKKKTLQRSTPNDSKTADIKASSRLTYIASVDTSNKSKRTFDMFDSVGLRFNHSLKSFDLSKIKLIQNQIIDSTTLLSIDSTRKLISIRARWKEDALYTIVLQKGFAQDNDGLQANAAEFSFKTKRKSDYGTLIIHTSKSENDIVELLKNNKVIGSQSMHDSLITFSFLYPDNYQVRLLHDKNKNGKWDTGSFFPEKHQPEIVELYPALITIKANWENKINLHDMITTKPVLKK